MGAHCQTCGRWFVHALAAMQHMSAVGHWQEYHDCDMCNNRYMYEEHLLNHKREEDHWAPTFECEACNLAFTSQQAARRHMDQSNHWRVHWCGPCQRGFQNENNLDQVRQRFQ